MSFFKDFKEDFAQAMNELMPDSNEMYDEDDLPEELPEVKPEKKKDVSRKTKSEKKETGKKEEKPVRQKKQNVHKQKGVPKTGDDVVVSDEDDIAPEDLLGQIDEMLEQELYGDDMEPLLPDDMEVNTMDDMSVEDLLNQLSEEKDMVEKSSQEQVESETLGEQLSIDDMLDQLQNGVSEEIAMETANDAGFDEAIAESLPVTENNAVESESYQGVDMGLEELLNSIAGDSKSKTETSTVSETDMQNATGEALAQVVEPDIQSGRIDDSADSSANAVEPEKITEPQEVAEPQIVAEESQAVDEPIEQSEEPPAVTTEEQALEKLLQEEAQASLEGTALSSMKHGKALEETVKESVSQEKESQPQPETSDLLAQLDADKKPEEPETSDLLAQLDADKQTAEPEASDLLAQLDADKKPEEPETSDLLAQLDADKEPAEPEASDLLAQLDADKESAEPETSDLLAQLDAGKELAEPEASDLLAQLDADKQTTEQAVQTEVKQTAETEQTTETAKTDLKIGRETENVVNDENEKLKEKEMSEEKDVISINSVEEKKEPVAEPSTDMSFNVENADPETTYITKGTKIKGDLETDGSIDIIGRVEGNVICQGKLVVGGEVVGGITAGEIYANNARIQGDVKSYGSVKVGVGSMIIGGIEGESAVIAGAVNGDIDVKGPVIVDSTAVIMGNIKSRSVQINNGAVIEGFCSQSYSDIDVKSFFA